MTNRYTVWASCHKIFSAQKMLPKKKQEKPAEELSPEQKAAELQKVTDVADRLRTAVAAHKATQNRSPDLVPLTQNFETFRKKLRSTIQAIKKYKEHSIWLQDARLKVRPNYGRLELFLNE